MKIECPNCLTLLDDTLQDKCSSCAGALPILSPPQKFAMQLLKYLGMLLSFGFVLSLVACVATVVKA